LGLVEKKTRAPFLWISRFSLRLQLQPQPLPEVRNFGLQNVQLESLERHEAPKDGELGLTGLHR
jgi:hypothetical protein